MLLTLVWGLNWPIMKFGVTHYPPLSFRTLLDVARLARALGGGAPVGCFAARRPQRVARAGPSLTVTNMLVWHVVAVVAVQALSSGRAAILGYTMPIFAALWGVALYGERLGRRQLSGVVAAAIGVGLLLWHELGHMAGRPWGAGGMLLAAAAWALGTLQLRRTRMTAHILAIIFWMTVITTVVMTGMATLFERDRWGAPSAVVWGSIVFNAVMIFGYAQPAWLYLARAVPPAASTLSVMMIPVLGTLAGAWWLNEQLHWQDFAAIVLMLAAIASVLWPARATPQSA